MSSGPRRTSRPSTLNPLRETPTRSVSSVAPGTSARCWISLLRSPRSSSPRSRHLIEPTKSIWALVARSRPPTRSTSARRGSRTSPRTRRRRTVCLGAGSGLRCAPAARSRGPRTSPGIADVLMEQIAAAALKRGDARTDEAKPEAQVGIGDVVARQLGTRLGGVGQRLVDHALCDQRRKRRLQCLVGHVRALQDRREHALAAPIASSASRAFSSAGNSAPSERSPSTISGDSGF